VGLDIRGVPVHYDVKKQVLSLGKIAAALPASKELSLDILIDRGSIEVFAERGRVAVVRGGVLAEGAPIRAWTRGEGTAVRHRVRELQGAWTP
jgi:hypothetical protein